MVRDASGIPHISAGTTDDLFFAQGFVQAQDRLFQMDLWKRSTQGRLSEVLGANFIQRDSMTRRIQFRGDLDREWDSYGPDTRRIAVAFTNGINAWVRMARQDLPEEFALAGWAPEFWRPEDLLNRTDAFLASGNALDELFRARLVAALGAQRVDQLLPLPDGRRTTLDSRRRSGSNHLCGAGRTAPDRDASVLPDTARTGQRRAATGPTVWPTRRTRGDATTSVRARRRSHACRTGAPAFEWCRLGHQRRQERDWCADAGGLVLRSL